MDLEALKKEKADLAAKIEAKKLEKELAAQKAELETLEKETKIEAVDSEVSMVKGMKKAAEESDFEKFSKIHAEKIAFETAKALNEKSSSKRIHFPAEVRKELGSKSDNVLALAKEMAEMLPTLDAAGLMLKKHISELSTFKKHFGEHKAETVDLAIKALVSTTSNAGDEYVPTSFSDSVAERLKDINNVAANLRVLDMPSNPYRIPIYTGVPTIYYCTEGSTITASDPTTDAKDLDAKKLMGRTVYSGEMEEDSIIPVLPFVQMSLLEALGNAVERSVLFGDTVTTASTNINLIDGTPTTTAGAASSYLAFDGLIKNALLGANGKKKDINADIVAGFASLMQLMGVGASDPKDLIAFMNVGLTYTYMGNSNFITFEKLGPNATLLKGQVGSIFGVAVVPSSGIPATNSAGKIPAAGGTLGSLVIVKKGGVIVGFKRRPMLKDNDILQAADQRAWVASARLDVKVTQPNQSDRAAVAYGYNAVL